MDNKEFKRKLRKYYQKELRTNPTSSENRLKNILKSNRIKFNFQKRLNWFYYDFLFRNKRLILELDGNYHETEKQQLQDLRKEVFAKKQGYTLIRFKNEEVWNNPEKILDTIRHYKPKEEVAIFHYGQLVKQ